MNLGGKINYKKLENYGYVFGDRHIKNFVLGREFTGKHF